MFIMYIMDLYNAAGQVPNMVLVADRIAAEYLLKAVYWSAPVQTLAKLTRLTLGFIESTARSFVLDRTMSLFQTRVR